MKKILPILIFIVILGIVGGGGYWYSSNNPAAWQQAMTDFGLSVDPEAAARLTASGFIEADEVAVAAEVGGRILELAVDRSDPVSAGQSVVRLDAALLDAQIEQAQAQIALAEAQLAQIKAGAPVEQIAVAEAAIVVTEADRDAAEQAIADAELLRDTPQQLNAQIDAIYSRLNLLDMQIRQAELIQNAVMLRESIAAEFWDYTQKGFNWSVTIPGMGNQSGHFDFKDGEKYSASAQWNLATMDVWQASVNLESAKTARQSALGSLATLQELKDNPLQGNLQVVQAKANYQVKLAAIDVAQANLLHAQAAVPQSRIEVVQANLEQAHTRLETLNTQREKFILTAPIDGIVVNRPAHVGEVALPGFSLMTVANLNNVTLTVYVPDADYGRLQLGQTVNVQVDTFPGRNFQGVITYINDEAEFTPKNVQTKDERVNLVYAVKITLPNPDGKLKPGMPADADFIEALEK